MVIACNGKTHVHDSDSGSGSDAACMTGSPAVAVSKTAYRSSDSAGCACVATQVHPPAPTADVEKLAQTQ